LLKIPALSRLALRKEPICLNCGTSLQARFCHQCGQENTEPHESFWVLIKHFVFDLLHFDGKFFVSLRYLLLKPGRLTKEYLKGKRASYFNPIRMYLFMSAVFFLLIFNLGSSEEALTAKEINIDSTSLSGVSQSTYDSSQQKLSVKERDGRIVYWLKKRIYASLESYKGRENELLQHIKERFIHLLPTWMMISLPLFSTILMLLYWRNKTFYFADHFIFTLHLYIAQYLQLIILVGLIRLHDILKWKLLNWFTFFMSVYLFIYTYKALRNVYLESRSKTILKFLALGFLLLILIFILALALGIQTLLSL